MITFCFLLCQHTPEADTDEEEDQEKTDDSCFREYFGIVSYIFRRLRRRDLLGAANRTHAYAVPQFGTAGFANHRITSNADRSLS